MDTIEKACFVTDCESTPDDLNATSTGSWICNEHLDEQKAIFEDSARNAMMDIGLTDDEAENALEDYNFTI